MKHINNFDPDIATLLLQETKRQEDGLVMIASENYASAAVLEAMSSPIQNKYSEGYPGRRYYTGNEFVDQIENLAISRAKDLFGVEHVNVQPHSGSTGNAAVYMACLKPGDTILGMNLSHGGHLTHGSAVNFSGQTYNFVSYGVSADNEQLDYEEIRRLALEHKPKMIVCGATAYPRAIDFKKFSDIAKEVNAYLHADISHIAGLIAAGVHQSPVGFANTIMTTTHKTLKGPRSAIIMSTINDPYQELYHSHTKKTLAGRIDSAVFPGLQGGPLEHVIAAKAIAFKEASSHYFKKIQEQTIENAKVLADIFATRGIRVVSGGTDTHLVLIDCMSIGVTGKEAANMLEKAGIYTNFNTIPTETRTPSDPSGLRIGTPALSSRGMGVTEMKIIANIMVDILTSKGDEAVISNSAQTVRALTSQFPIYTNL